MTELIETLFNYINENRIGCTHEEILRQAAIHRDLEQTEGAIAGLLPPEGRRQFEDYIWKNFQAQELALECTFRAGLSIGLELSRL